MEPNHSCPSEDEVADLIDGRAGPSTIERIFAHAESCDSCRRLLEGTLPARGSPLQTLSRRGKARTFLDAQVLQKRYRIDRFIARGGMGEVYEAWDLQLRETVALKTIIGTELDVPRQLDQVRAEVLLARRVTHPNVCRILEFGLYEPNSGNPNEAIPYFTMEYLRGETLKQHLSRRGVLTPYEIVPIALQILEGLGAAHAAGIVHRDLKPDNIFVIPSSDSKPRVVIMDFGLARPTTEQDSRLGTFSGSPAGTPAYMAPEQALGGKPSIAWDIYALGVILYELASGALPFTGDNAVAMALARERHAARSLRSIRRDIHPGFSSLVERCLRRDPRQRYSSVEDTKQALLQIRWSETRQIRRLPVVIVVGLALLGAAAFWRYQVGQHVHGREDSATRRVAGKGATDAKRDATTKQESQAHAVTSASNEPGPPSATPSAMTDKRTKTRNATLPQNPFRSNGKGGAPAQSTTRPIRDRGF